MNLDLLVATILEAMMIVAGVGEAEELTEDEIQRFRQYASHPLEINSADARELENSGLFTTFRTVALCDYISRNGPVLSVQELASVNGFDRKTAEALAYFVSFGSKTEDGGRRWTADSEFQAGTSASYPPSASGNTGSGEISAYWLSSARLQGRNHYVNAGASGLYEHGPKTEGCSLASFTLSCGVDVPKAGLKLYLGDFNARFGQGAILWNTLQINSSTSSASLIQRPSGLAVSHSLKGNYAKTGVGVSWTGKRLGLSAAFSLPGFKSAVMAASSGRRHSVAGFEPLLNLNYWGRFCSVGMTSVADIFPGASGPEISAALSTDFRTCIKGVDLAGEIAVIFSPQEAPAAAARLACTASAGEWFKGGASASYTKERHEARLILEADAPGNHHFALGATFLNRTGSGTARIDATALFRWSERFRLDIRVKENLSFATPAHKSFGCRGGFSSTWAAGWTTSLVAACSKASEWGLALYAEQEYKTDSLVSAHLRTGIFSIDDWDGRICFYEHDIPGRFTVPALYGRGYWISAHLNARITRTFRLSLRIAYKNYVLMEPETRKPSVLDARLSFSTDF
ncbi:MAG: hypothetical protein ACI39U_02340 [Candidatus Cryptobacteroides sp.]